MHKQKLTDALEPIDDSKTYALPSFMQHVGWGRHAMRQARLQGLRVVKMGGRIFVRGRDFSEFLGTIGTEGEVAQ